MMAIECCGKERDENFCPFCGKKLKDFPISIEGLLVHCKNRTNQLVRRIAILEKQVATRTEGYWHKDLGRTKVIYHKWNEWSKLLEKLMESRP